MSKYTKRAGDVGLLRTVYITAKTKANALAKFQRTYKTKGKVIN